MKITPEILPTLVNGIVEVIEGNAEEITVLDQVLGDGDHVINLQRGLDALVQQTDELSQLNWSEAFMKIGMILLSTMGGASGSLFGTLFISISKAIDTDQVTLQEFSKAFTLGVEAVKKRGKAFAGEKTMLDVLIPVSDALKQSAEAGIETSESLKNICQTAVYGMESTRDMIATKGRASYMQEKSIGHIDAGAKTSQLMICAVIKEIQQAA